MNTTKTDSALVSPDTSFKLAQGTLLQLAPEGAPIAAPWILQVRAGAVWVTWPGCGDDVFLAAGEQVQVPAAVSALVEVEPRMAPGAAMLRVSVPGHRAKPARVMRWPWLARPRMA